MRRAGLMAAVAAVGVAAAVPGAALAAEGATATFAKTDDWGSGFVGEYTIRNGGSRPIDGWRLQFDMPAGTRVTDLWSGRLTSEGQHEIVEPEDWTRRIEPGATVTVGFQGESAGAFAAPLSCRLDGTACDGGATPPDGGDPPVVDPPPVDDPPVTDPPADGGGTGGGGTGAGRTDYAPYVDMTLYPQFSLAGAARDAGTKRFTLGFVVSRNPCQASWGGYLPFGEDQFVTDSLSALRAQGGDAIVSFGGAANQELAMTCSTPGALADEYQRVIDRYGVDSIDFDVEGGAVRDAASIERRSQAIARLQADARAAGRPLTVSFTLATMPSGLTEDGLNVLRSAIAAGVRIDVVNLMAMDYFDPSLNVDGHMGDLAIQAATSLHGQLAQLYPGRSDAELWKMVGITPMLGINDNPAEVFTTADARKVADFAAQKGIGRLATWSANRDAPCPTQTSTTQNTCSGVPDAQWSFARAFIS